MPYGSTTRTAFACSSGQPKTRLSTPVSASSGGSGQLTLPPPDEPARPSERMRRLGVVQDGDPILRKPAEPFDLPGERDVAAGLGELLIAYLGPIRAAHVFGKGQGLAAPQIGVSRGAAVVQLPDGARAPGASSPRRTTPTSSTRAP
jgi:polypeptide deformylase